MEEITLGVGLANELALIIATILIISPIFGLKKLLTLN